MLRNARNRERSSYSIGDTPTFTALHKSSLPREFKLPNAPSEFIVRTTWTASVVGFLCGTAYEVLRNGYDSALVPEGGLTQGAAIGTSVSLALMAVYGAGVAAYKGWYAYQHRAHRTLVDDSETYDKERDRVWYLLSDTVFYPFDLRVFLGAVTGAVLGASLLNFQNPSSVSVLAGLGVGGVFGAASAFAHVPFLIRTLIDWGHMIDEPRYIESRHCLKESRHNVPWFVRGFFGSTAGLVLSQLLWGAMGADQAREQLILTATSTGLALSSPLLFAIARLCFPSLKQDGELSEHTQIAWFRPTHIDVPWYVRACVGAILGLGVTTLVNSVFDASLSPAFGLVVSALPLITPIVSALFRQMERCYQSIEECLSTYTALEDEKRSWPDAPKLGIDLPWYILCVTGMLSGYMMGSAIESLGMHPFSYFKETSVAVITLMSLLSPVYNTLVTRTCRNNDQEANGNIRDVPDLYLPFSMRMLMTGMTGYLIANAYATLQYNATTVLQADDAFFDFTAMGLHATAEGAMGTLIGMSVGWILPMIFSFGSKVAACVQHRTCGALEHVSMFRQRPESRPTRLPSGVKQYSDGFAYASR